MKFPPVPPPVRLAPLGCDRDNEKTVPAMALEVLTPIGRESSAKAQLSDVHRHFPAIGSQNGVEQLAGTRQEISRGTVWEAQVKLTTDTRLLPTRHRLFRVRVGGSWNFLGAPVLKNGY